ncbi:MAG: DUF1501 domain-containing protein, partial [Planctomycetaceae bacterium]|nr:DUF1501 domain-containing protein [Planctomycetaceae bacterium]
MNPLIESRLLATRRHFLQQSAMGVGGLALSSLMAGNAQAAPEVVNPLAPRKSPLAPRAQRVIYLHLTGSPPHLDLYDYKPELVKHHGKETQGANTIKPFFGKRGTVMKSPWNFKQYGRSGQWVSDMLPHIAKRVDDLTFLNGMVSRSNAHGPAIFQMSTGFIFQGFPSVGSWVSYGLGSENENLPSFVVLPDNRGLPPCG